MKKIGLALFIIFVLYFIFLIRQDIIDNLKLKQDFRSTEVKLGYETLRGSQLVVRLKALNNLDQIEKLARTRLALVKKGETAYKVFYK